MNPGAFQYHLTEDVGLGLRPWLTDNSGECLWLFKNSWTHTSTCVKKLTFFILGFQMPSWDPGDTLILVGRPSS